MFPQRKPQPNEVVGAELSQEALRRLHEFHVAWIAGRQGGRRAMLRDCGLAGCDLTHMNLSAAVLLDCDFTGIAARGTKFTGAILRGATFDRADLTGADFAGADLRGASFLDAQLVPPIKGPELRRLDPARLAEIVTRHGIWIASESAQGARADFSGIDLSALDLSGRNLCLADLSRAILADTQLKGALLIAADFRNADLTRVNLAGADIRGANFQGAHCRDVGLSNTRIGAIPGLALTTRGL